MSLPLPCLISPLPLPSSVTLFPPLRPSFPSSSSGVSHLGDITSDRSTLPLSSPLPFFPLFSNYFSSLPTPPPFSLAVGAARRSPLPLSPMTATSSRAAPFPRALGHHEPLPPMVALRARQHPREREEARGGERCGELDEEA
jgi:hypothetical protein